MRILNIVILTVFSFAGSITYRENITEGLFSTWEEIFVLFPTALFTGVSLLAVSLVNTRFKNWETFNFSRFIFNAMQPHIFIGGIGSIFFFGGILGIAISIIIGVPISKFSAMLVLTGSGFALPAILICMHLSAKKDA